MPKNNKRINKTKPQVVNDIKAVQNADRMRKLVRERVYPFLLELNDTVGYSKVFLQTSATALENVFSEGQRTTKVSDLMPKLEKIFDTTDKKQSAEFGKYRRLFEIMKDETVFDFTTMIQSMPRVIEQYFTHETDKRAVLDIDINKILG